jgi:MFS transporter, DHA1 family, multidrug resistance protein
MVVVTVLDLGLWPLIALLVLNMLATGILLPAVPVIALEANAHRAGSAAALLGAMQFGVGAALAPVTGLFPEGSPVAMAAVMFGATAVAVCLMFAIRPAMKRISREVVLASSVDRKVDATALAEADELVVEERVV